MTKRKRRITLYSFTTVLSIIILISICLFCSTKGIEKSPPKAADKSREINDINSSAKKIIDVPYLSQREKYPTGCESVSATMILNYWGYDISTDTFIDAYLPKGIAPYQGRDGKYIADDPTKCFLGNPYSEQGWGCYSPVIIKCLQNVLDKTDLQVKDLRENSLNELCENYISNNIPVMIWATIDMKPAHRSKSWKHLHDENYTTWISPMHALVLTGYDQEYYYFNDPWQEKNTKYPKEEVEKSYLALGRQAVAIVSKK